MIQSRDVIRSAERSGQRIGQPLCVLLLSLTLCAAVGGQDKQSQVPVFTPPAATPNDTLKSVEVHQDGVAPYKEKGQPFRLLWVGAGKLDIARTNSQATVELLEKYAFTRLCTKAAVFIPEITGATNSFYSRHNCFAESNRGGGSSDISIAG